MMMLSFLAFHQIERPAPFEHFTEANEDKEKCYFEVHDKIDSLEWLKNMYNIRDIKSLYELNPKLRTACPTTLYDMMPIKIEKPCAQIYSGELVHTNPAFKGHPLSVNGSLILSICYIMQQSAEQCKEIFSKAVNNYFNRLDQYGNPHPRYDEYNTPYMNTVINSVANVDTDYVRNIDFQKKYLMDNYEYLLCMSTKLPPRFIVYDIWSDSVAVNPSFAELKDLNGQDIFPSKNCIAVKYKGPKTD